MSPADHERIEALIAEEALGGLDAEGERELARERELHGPDCAECQRLERDYREVAGRLASALPPAAVPRGMEDRLLTRARARAGRPVTAGRRAGAARRFLAAAAAAAVLAVGGLGGYVLGTRANAEVSALAGFIARPGTRVVSFSGEGQGTLAAAFRPGERSVYVVGSNLSPPGAGKVYELWLIRGRTPAPAGTFVPRGDLVVERLEADPSTADVLAVTVEEAPGAKRPTTEPIFTAEVGV